MKPTRATSFPDLMTQARSVQQITFQTPLDQLSMKLATASVTRRHSMHDDEYEETWRETVQRELQKRSELQRSIERVDTETDRKLAEVLRLLLARNDRTRVSKCPRLRSARVHSDSWIHVLRPRDRGFLRSDEARQRAQFLLDGVDKVLRFRHPRG